MFQSVDCVLLDIEGTVSDVRFVYDVMFPYAKNGMRDFLIAELNRTEVQQAIEQVAVDASYSVSDWLGSSNTSPDEVITKIAKHLDELMAMDSKSTGLKMLQGLVWKNGFESGALRAELFDDVLPAMKRWKDSGIDLRIYSSGSVLAQKLFFGHTTHGDVSDLLSGFYDTNMGKKQEMSSYQRIANDIGLAAARVLFVSDVAQELTAASEAGMQVVASVRPNNKPLDPSYSGPAIYSFDQIHIDRIG